MTITNEQASEIASMWHSVMTWNDPGVAMYSVTSTGKIHSEKHRADLLTYIDGCLVTAAVADLDGDESVLGESNVNDLEMLRDWVTAFEVTDGD